jgi:glycerate kinase
VICSAPMRDLSTRPLLAAPDKFKGTFRAAEVAAAMGRGFERAGRRADTLPVADGGDGTGEVLLLGLGGETGGATVRDPLGREVEAGLALLEDGGTAVVEAAAASGLALLAEDERDAEAASSTGTGDLILAAVEHGAEVVLVCAGGTASTDGGRGAIEAIEAGGGLRGARLVVLCDVRVAWESAARTFGPQKGADAAAVRRLARRLREYADRLPRDPRGEPLTGCGGGLSGGLWAVFGARLEPGAPFVLDALGFDERMRAAHAVVAGEGRLDATTLHGKALAEVAVRARQAGVPAYAVVGSNQLDRFSQRILDLSIIREATTLAEIEAAAQAIAEIA